MKLKLPKPELKFGRINPIKARAAKVARRSGATLVGETFSIDSCDLLRLFQSLETTKKITRILATENLIHCKGEKLEKKQQSKSWMPAGITKLVNAAIGFFSNQTSTTNLPYNLANSGPHGRFPDSVRLTDFWECFEQGARFSGWLRAAAKIPALVQLIRRTQSANGMGSPATAMSLWSIAERHPSPHRAARFLIAVRRRANQILTAYGLKVSWRVLGETLAVSPRQVGRAAVYAAALTIRNYKRIDGIYQTGFWDSDSHHYYRHARSLFIKMRGWQEAEKYPIAVRCWASEKVSSGEFGCLAVALEATVTRLIQVDVEESQIWLDLQTEKRVGDYRLLLGRDNNLQLYWVVAANQSGRLALAWWNTCRPKQAVDVARYKWAMQDAVAAGCPVVEMTDEIWQYFDKSGYHHDRIDWETWELVSRSNGSPSEGYREPLPEPPFVIRLKHFRRWKQHSAEESVREYFVAKKEPVANFPNSEK